MSAATVRTTDAPDVRLVTPARACPVCHAVDGIHLSTQRYCLFDDSALPRTTEIVRCNGCGTAYASSDAGGAAYRAHYADHSKYDTAVSASGSGETAEDHERLRETAAFLAGHWNRSASALDIGAGRGGLIQALADQGFTDVTGIDPSAGCVATMHARGFVAAQGLVEDHDWATDPKRYDAVVLSHVLEHVYDVDAALDHIERRMTDDGALYVEVPDAARYVGTAFPPNYFFDPEHINHFDAVALAALASRRGWSVVESWPRWLGLVGGQRYPALGVVLRRRSARAVLATTPSDGLERYIAECERRVAQELPLRGISAMVERGDPLVVWGAGSYAQRLLSQTSLGDAAIECIIDNDPGKQGRRLDGRPIVARDEGLAKARAVGAAIVVAIAVDPAPVIADLRARAPDLNVITP